MVYPMFSRSHYEDLGEMGGSRGLGGYVQKEMGGSRGLMVRESGL